ncbi:MAG: hypothetical protein DRP08_01080 [Candidatus Aenigmatarchaeota archaeon]|nr:MAG: hypothetical protein DRP08_01080 [Candidatus Aenigmarchaeota archaeon]
MISRWWRSKRLTLIKSSKDQLVIDMDSVESIKSGTYSTQFGGIGAELIFSTVNGKNHGLVCEDKEEATKIMEELSND